MNIYIKKKKIGFFKNIGPFKTAAELIIFNFYNLDLYTNAKMDYAPLIL